MTDVTSSRRHPALAPVLGGPADGRGVRRPNRAGAGRPDRGELGDLLRDLPAGPRVPVTAATGALPQRAPGCTVLVPAAVLAGIGIAVAMSAGTGHVRWGILWLLLPVLLIARRMTWCAGVPSPGPDPSSAPARNSAFPSSPGIPAQPRAGQLGGWVPDDPLGPERRAADLAGVIAQRSGGALDRTGQLVRGQPLA